MENDVFVDCVWKDKLTFDAVIDEMHVIQDAKPPLGSGLGPSPKQLLLSAICGCTGMDVVSLLKKFRQEVGAFHIDGSGELTQEHPVIFKVVNLKFVFTGANLDPEKVKKAVHLSQTRYCGVSAMVSKAVDIFYSIELNGKTIATGQADFSEEIKRPPEAR